MDGDDKEVGSYAVDFDGYDDEVIMTDELTVALGDRAAGFRSSVTFVPDDQGVMRPDVASATTFVDGEPCMRGTVTFGEATYRYSGEGVMDAASGDPIDPPVTFEQGAEPKPGPLIVFPQALVFMGPVWQPEAGEQVVVIAEFPDDIAAPELIEFEADCRLVRTAPDDVGNFAIELIGRDCVSLTLFPNWRMVDRAAVKVDQETPADTDEGEDGEIDAAPETTDE